MSEFWRGFLFGLGAGGGVIIVLAIVGIDAYMRPFRR